MHPVSSALFLVASTATTSSTTAKSGSSAFLLVIVILFAVLYFVLIRPNQRRRMQAMRQARAFDLGDEVVAGGMVGQVVRVGDGEVDVEVADGVVLHFVPNAVQSRAAYMAGPAGRGLAGGRGFGAGQASAAGGRGSGTSGPAPLAPGRRNVGRRGSASDSWPDAGDNSADDGGFGSAGPSGGLAGGAPSGSDWGGTAGTTDGFGGPGQAGLSGTGGDEGTAPAGGGR